MILRYAPVEGGSGHDIGLRLLEEMYRETTGCAMPPIQRTPMGKPYFSEGNLHFSISHTRTSVFCVLSEKPVGIDAEEADRKINLRLAEKILSAGEQTQFDRAEDKYSALLRFWVLKEAQAKLTGKGLPIYPNHTNFDLDDPRIQVLNGHLVAVLTEE